MERKWLVALCYTFKDQIAIQIILKIQEICQTRKELLKTLYYSG